MKNLIWEIVTESLTEDKQAHEVTMRLKIEGGWLYKSESLDIDLFGVARSSQSMVFVPLKGEMND